MKQQKMKYALIGCGMISPNHIKAALECDLKIVTLCDLMESNREKALELIPEDKRSGVKLYMPIIRKCWRSCTRSLWRSRLAAG